MAKRVVLSPVKAVEQWTRKDGTQFHKIVVRHRNGTFHGATNYPDKYRVSK